MNTDETDATVKFRGQPFKVARFCARKRVGLEDVRGVEWRSDEVKLRPSSVSGKGQGGGTLQLAREERVSEVEHWAPWL